MKPIREYYLSGKLEEALTIFQNLTRQDGLLYLDALDVLVNAICWEGRVVEFLDCIMGPNLDMMAKQFPQASEVPQTDANIVFYHEFVYCLVEKQWAAVARLLEKTTNILLVGKVWPLSVIIYFVQ